MAKDTKEERRLRMLAWWKSNHPDREEQFRRIEEDWNLDRESSTSAEQMNELDTQRRQNMEILSGLFDDSNHDLLLKAETLRELGEFDNAKSLLARIADDKDAPWIEQLRSLCDAHDIKVTERVPLDE